MRLDRHDPAGGLAQGLLLAEHFQMGYATNDLAAARRLFADRFGIRDFRRLEGPMAAGGTMRADFAWVGTVMYELIEATGPGSDIYRSRLPTGDGLHVAHHHLGFLVPDRADWDAMLAAVAAAGWSIPSRADNALLEGCFVEVPGLGHYLEYLHPRQAGLDFFASVPRH